MEFKNLSSEQLIKEYAIEYVLSLSNSYMSDRITRLNQEVLHRMNNVVFVVSKTYSYDNSITIDSVWNGEQSANKYIDEKNAESKTEELFRNHYECDSFILNQP